MAKGKGKNKAADQAGKKDASSAYAPEQAAELERLRRAVDGRLSGHRLEHVRGVADTARRLALRYGVDPFLAEAAGLLHDWDKKLSPDELWKKAQRYGVDVPRDERLVAPLHSWTAAASLPGEFPELPPAVFQAVGRHTVGAPDMTGLDMVVFVADMLEPGREGAEVDELRALADSVPLSALFAACVRRSVVYVLQTGRYLYPPAIDVWNAYCAELPEGLALGRGRSTSPR